MYIMPISCCDNMSSKRKFKIPDRLFIKQQEKAENIQALEIASMFEKFEQNLRATIEALVYMINK